MHVAWIGKKSPFCGNVTYGRELTNALLKRGHQVSFIHFERHNLSRRAEHGHYREVVLPFIYKSQVYTLPSLGSSKILAQSLSKLKPDVVHASLTLSPMDLQLPNICDELNLPLVATFHTAFDDKQFNLVSASQLLTYYFYAPFLAKYHRVIVFSEMQARLLEKLGVPPHVLSIIPNGVDSQKYAPNYSTLKSELNAKRIFLYLGRIAPEKNLESLLKAWQESKMGADNKLLIVGDGWMRPSLEHCYKKESNIIWWGPEFNEERRINILRGSDVFILPSLVEGLSLSLLEAMSCGLACVATDAGADGEVLAGGAGIILKTKDVTNQLRTILPLLRDHSELTHGLGQKARQRVLERYTLTRNFQCLESLYYKLLQDK